MDEKYKFYLFDENQGKRLLSSSIIFMVIFIFLSLIEQAQAAQFIYQSLSYKINT